MTDFDAITELRERLSLIPAFREDAHAGAPGDLLSAQSRATCAASSWLAMCRIIERGISDALRAYWREHPGCSDVEALNALVQKWDAIERETKK